MLLHVTHRHNYETCPLSDEDPTTTVQLLAEIMSGADDVKVIGTWLNGPAHEGYMVLRWRISPPKPTAGTNCGSWRSYNDSCN